MMPPGLVFIGAFLLAGEKTQSPAEGALKDRLKILWMESLHLGWQWGLLALLCAGGNRLGQSFPFAAYLDKGLCVAGAWLLSRVRRENTAYFMVLAALAFGTAGAPGLSGKEMFVDAGQMLGGIFAVQALFSGLKERLLLAKIPSAAEGLPIALLSFSLISLTLWAAGFNF